jgi:histidinol-phosphate aminotransferase
MINWLVEKLDKISTFNNYKKPIRNRGFVNLDANENYALKKRFISEIVFRAIKDTDLREYPMEQLEDLYKQLSKYTGVSEKYLGIGNGSDQIIELILSHIGSKQRVATFTPTFSYFINRCQVHEIIVNRVPLNKEDNTLHKLKFLQTAKRSDMIYICSPNNPTGNQFDRQSILEIINSLEDKLILLDEAYVEFADYSLSPMATKYDNVIVLRTLSKAFGLAGARVGYFIANEQFAQIFRSNIQSPYPLNSISLRVARIVLSRFGYVKNTIKTIKQERKRVFDELAKINGIKAFESNANFVFFETYEKYDEILKAIKREKLVVKAFGNIEGRKGCIRVTIGTKSLNDKFLKAIKKAL